VISFSLTFFTQETRRALLQKSQVRSQREQHQFSVKEYLSGIYYNPVSIVLKHCSALFFPEQWENRTVQEYEQRGGNCNGMAKTDEILITSLLLPAVVSPESITV